MRLNIRAIASLSFLILFFATGVTPTSRASIPAGLPPTPLQKKGEGGAIDTSQLVQQGRELYEAGQFSQAVKVWQQAAKTYQTTKDLPSLAMVLSNLSLAYQQLGQLNQAKQAIADSFSLLGYSEEKG